MADFIRIVEGISEESFLQKYSHPFLVTSRDQFREIRSLTSDQPLPDGDRFSTMISNTKSTDMEKKWLQEAWVIPITNQEGGEMQMVNLGRTGNNDLVIPLPVVSKFHCCFMIYGPQEVYIIDGGSTNGTFLNGKMLTANEKEQLKSGDIIRFGKKLEFEFYFSQDMYRELPEFKKVIFQS